jgi:hypothetical protein
MKRFVTPCLWVLLGSSIGAGAVLTSGRVQAQQPTNVDAARIVITPASRATGRWVHADNSAWIEGPPPIQFIKDTKSGGCWIGSIGDNGVFVSIAVAPPAACD